MEVNQTIITGLGRKLALIEDDGALLDLHEPPQATSTQANKKTRQDLAGEYLASLEEERESSSGGFRRMRSSTSGQTAIHLILSTNKVDKGDSISGGEQESSSLGSMGAFQLINVDSMSGLSSSRFLVDHTQLGVGEYHHPLPSPEDGETLPKQHLGTSPLPTTPPKAAAPPLPSANSPLSASELSQGELGLEELLSVQGLDPKYLEQSPEVLRCQDHSLTRDQSTLPSLHSHHFGSEDEVSELPLSMVEPQRWQEESQGLQEQQDYSQFQISGLCEVEKSKLLSTTCNSRGSLGHDEVDPEALEQSREVGGKFGSEWVAEEQGELASMMEGEEFNSPNLDFFEEEERVHREEHRFEQGDASVGDHLDFSNFSGIHGVTEITVRPSWIPSPDRPLVGENNKMAVEDYLRARSDTLGCLGSNENRPNFGTLVHSPPAATRPTQLLSLTQDESDTLQDFSHSGSSSSDTSGSEADISFSNKAQFSEDRQPEKYSASSNMMKKNHLNGSYENSSVGNKNELMKTENKKSIEEIYKKQKVSSFQGPNKYLPKSELMKADSKGNIEDKHTSRKTAGAQLHDICVPNREEPTEAELSLMQRTIDLEQSLRDMGGPMPVDKITSLLHEAQVSHNPHTLITKILGMLKEKSVLHETMDVTNFDMSTDVLELRRQREAVMARAGPCRQPVGKENVLKVIKGPDRKMPQVSQGSTQGKSLLAVPRKHMEKLNAQRTRSDPGVARQVQEARYSHLEDELEDTNIDESIREAQYRSRILEDTAKLQLPSFHESKGIGVETSTPCPSHARVQADVRTASSDVPCSKTHRPDDDRLFLRPQGHYTSESSKTSVSKQGGQAPPNMTKKPQPRMGVLGQGRGVGRGTDVQVPPPHSSQTSGVTTGKTTIAPRPSRSHTHTAATIKEVSNVPRSIYTRNEARGETDSKSTSREIRNIPVTTSTSARSTSVPTDLQSLGVVDGSNRSATVPPPATNSAHRQHHSQENVSRSAGNSAGVCVPEQVSLGQACVLGMATYTTFTLYNPRPRWTHFSLKLVKESLDGAASSVSALLFEPSYFLKPGGRCQAKLGLCGQFKGHLEAMIEVRLTDLAKEGNGPAALAPVSQSSTHTLTVSASISEPDVRVWCEGEDGVGEKVLDFGVVAEGCLVSRQVTLTNLSPQPLPVILHLQQMAVTSPIFYWEPHKNSTGKVVSVTCLACELAAPASVPTSTDHLTSQPAPVTLTVTFKAPHLDNVEVGESGVVGVRSVMQVEMDAPDQSKIIIASFPFKASIGAVCLETQRVSEPLTLEGTADTSPEASFTLRSSSSFPLRVSLAVRDHKDVFSVRPDTLVVQPHSRITPCIVFTPRGWVGRVESSLVIRIEPEGMDFEISIAGVSHKARPLLLPPQPSPLPHPHPAGNPQSRKQVLGNLASSHHPTALTKSNSNPVERNPSRALESTKSRLVFGAVEIGGSSSQKLVFRNTCTSHKLSIVLSIIGSQSFQLQESVGEEHQSKVKLVLEPCQELPLSISLRPSAVEPLSATLVCKYHSVANPFKCRIPLQGYGGKGTLTIPNHCKELPFVMHSLTPGLPSLLRTPFVNTGTRAIFVKFQIFTDEECTSLVTASDISVMPSEFVLGAGGASRDIFLVANGTPAILAKAQGTLGYLHIVSGDEVLRQRYKRLKNKEVNVRRIKDLSLLGLDYGASFSREEDVLQEEPDTLPPQPEDATVFHNCCSKMIIELYGERQASEDNSSTAFVIVNAEDTLSSMIDCSMAAERTGGVPSPPPPSQSSFIRPLAHPTSQAAHQTHLTAITTHLRPPVSAAPHVTSATSSNTTWDVFPQSLSILASDTMSHDFFVVNYGNGQQTFEVRSSCPSLQVKPSEALLPGLSSVKVSVTLATPPRALSASTSHTLKFMCENESCSVTITILPTAEEGTLHPHPENHLPPPPPSHHPPPPPSHHAPPPSHHAPPPSHHAPPPSHHPPPPSHPPPPPPSLHPPPLHHPSSFLHPPPTASNKKGRKDGTPSSHQTSESKLSGHPSSTNATTSVSHHRVGGEVSSSGGRQSLVRVLAETASFPDTVAGKESIVKVKLTNQDTETLAIRAAVTSGPFVVRHSEFYMKPGHFSSLPVYFRPERPGAYTGRLHLTVLASNTLHTVHLSGTATL